MVVLVYHFQQSPSFFGLMGLLKIQMYDDHILLSVPLFMIKPIVACDPPVPNEGALILTY